MFDHYEVDQDALKKSYDKFSPEEQKVIDEMAKTFKQLVEEKENDNT